MICEYFQKYCSYYLSRYSVSKKKFEHVLKQKIYKDYYNNKFSKEKYDQYIKKINDVSSYYKNLGFFDEENLISMKIDTYIRKGFSLKKISLNLNKEFFSEKLISIKISEIKQLNNIHEKLIENFLKRKKNIFNPKDSNQTKKEYFDKILKKLLQQGFDYQKCFEFLKKKINT